jgi:hypothetical protein
MPYNRSAVEWSDEHFDLTYVARWCPQSLPTLVVSGGEDRIVDQSLWDDPYYQGDNVRHAVVEDGAHFLWIRTARGGRTGVPPERMRARRAARIERSSTTRVRGVQATAGPLPCGDGGAA